MQFASEFQHYFAPTLGRIDDIAHSSCAFSLSPEKSHVKEDMNKIE